MALLGVEHLDFYHEHVLEGDNKEHQDVLHAHREQVQSIAHTMPAHPLAIPVPPMTPLPAADKRKQLGKANFRPAGSCS